jgi:nucleoside-diphosphate-sugar epimerase
MSDLAAITGGAGFIGSHLTEGFASLSAVRNDPEHRHWNADFAQ